RMATAAAHLPSLTATTGAWTIGAAAADLTPLAPSACAWSIATADVAPLAATTGAWTIAARTRMQHLLSASAAEIETVLRASGNGVAIPAEFLRDIGIGVADAVSVVRIVLPISHVDVVDVDVAIDVDVVAAPVKTAAPVIAARGPAAESIPGAESK